MDIAIYNITANDVQNIIVSVQYKDCRNDIQKNLKRAARNRKDRWITIVMLNATL